MIDGNLNNIDVEKLSSYFIANIDLSNVSQIKDALRNLINLYSKTDITLFYKDEFYKKIVNDYCYSLGTLNTKKYTEIENFCSNEITKKIISDQKVHNLLNDKLTRINKIMNTNININDDDFIDIVNIYSYIIPVSDKLTDYILTRLLLNTNSIPKFVYITFIKKLGQHLYSKRVDGEFLLENDIDYKTVHNHVAFYDHDGKHIVFNTHYLNQQSLIDNICTIFHEINHAIQDVVIDKYNYEDYQMKKDMILNLLIENYNKNYFSKKNEYYAQANAEKETIAYLGRLKFINPKNLKDRYKNSEIRINETGYFKTSLDELFEKTMKNNSKVFKRIYYFFDKEYDNNGNRYMISYLLDKRNSTHDEKKIKFYNDLIYKHTYSYKEIISNINDLKLKLKKENNQEYKDILHHLIGEKIFSRIKISLANITYLNKQLILSLTINQNELEFVKYNKDEIKKNK